MRSCQNERASFFRAANAAMPSFGMVTVRFAAFRLAPLASPAAVRPVP